MHGITSICRPRQKLQQLLLICLVIFTMLPAGVSAQIFFPLPTAELSGSSTICEGESATLTLSVSGYRPIQVVYTDGTENYTISNITASNHIFSVAPESTTKYELVSVRDRFGRQGNVSGSAVVSVVTSPRGGRVTGEYSEILLTMPTGTLTLSDHEGSILKWQKKVNGGGWTDISHTRATYSETPSVTGTHLYRAVVHTICGTADSESFEIIVSNSPSIVDVNYDASDGSLVFHGQYLRTGLEIDLTKMTISNGEHSYRFSGRTDNISPSSSNLATVVVEEKERAYLNRILNNNGLRSADNIPYNLSVEEDWNGMALNDPEIPVALSGFEIPSINSAVYDSRESTLDVSASGLVAAPDVKDIDATRFTITGKDNKSYTLTSASSDVDVLSSSNFIINIGEADKTEIDRLTDIAGTLSSTGHPYNLAAENGWNRPAHSSFDIADLTGNHVEARGIVNQPPQALDPDISGIMAVCKVLEATYEYFDPEGDPEGETIITWFRAEDDSGAGEQEIHRGPDYMLALEDEGMFIRAIIAPVAAQGTAEGTPVPTPWHGPVENLLPTVSLAGPAEFCQGSFIEIVFELTGTGPWTVSYTDGTNQYDFTAASSPFILDVSEAGTYRVTAVTDAEGCEGTELGSELVVNSVPAVVVGDWYAEAFDSPSSLWASAASAGADIWTYGPPEGDIFTSAAAGDYIWHTEIADPANPGQSAVTSPCFDLSQSVRPMIAIDLWKELGQDSDGAVLQYSLNNDGDWKNIGATGQGINWYNSSQIKGMPGGQQTGWTGAEEGWTESRHDLDVVAGRGQVRFRIAYGNDGSGESGGGLAFDNVRIGERTRLVLVEHFTNALDENSIGANQILQEAAESNPRDIAYISYHSAQPQGDPLNSQNPADPAARALYYGISTVPFSVIDGGSAGNGKFDYSPEGPDDQELLRRALVDPSFEIEILPDHDENLLNLTINVMPVRDQEGKELTLHVAILETEVSVPLPGSEDVTVFRNVARKLLPDAGGTVLPANITANRPETFRFSWSMTGIQDARNLAVVAFIQDIHTKEIYQAGISAGSGLPTSAAIPGPGQEKIPNSPVFYPNPAQGSLFIKFAEELTTDHVLEVYTLSGNLVRTEIIRTGETIYELNTAGMHRGMYLFMIRNHTGIQGRERVIIME